MIPHVIDFVRHHVLTLSALDRFGLTLVMLVLIPRLCRRAHVPTAVGLLLSGVIVGPYVLGFFGTNRPIADFLSELGKLLLMFFAGLEIDLALFRRARKRSVTFGLITTMMPLLLGTAVGLAFGYAAIPAIVIGSLLASHTLLGLPVIDRLGLHRLEPVTVTVGATVMSDTLSLVVFAVCVSIFTTGFSPTGLTLLLSEIVGFVVLVLFGLSRLGAYVLSRSSTKRTRTSSSCSASWWWRACSPTPSSCRASSGRSWRGSRSTPPRATSPPASSCSSSASRCSFQSSSSPPAS